MFVVIKTIVLINIFLVCIYLGNLKAKKFEIRVSELKKIKNALNMFKTKIQFTYEPIKDIFAEISHIIYKDNSNIFISATETLKYKDISEAWSEAVNMNRDNFDAEDVEIMKMFGKLLGKTDKVGQISEIDLTSGFVDKQIEKAEHEKVKNSKMYRTLGTVIGLVIIIILI